SEPLSLRQGLLAHYELRDGLLDSSGNYRHGRSIRGETSPLQTPVGEQLEFLANNFAQLGRIELGSVFSVAFWLRVGSTRADLGQNNPHTSVLRQTNSMEVWYD